MIVSHKSIVEEVKIDNPGIVKYYSYKMVPYILADNPNIEYSRAIELSMQMTYRRVLICSLYGRQIK